MIFSYLGKSYLMETTVERFDQIVVGGTACSSEMIVFFLRRTFWISQQAFMWNFLACILALFSWYAVVDYNDRMNGEMALFIDSEAGWTLMSVGIQYLLNAVFETASRGVITLDIV